MSETPKPTQDAPVPDPDVVKTLGIGKKRSRKGRWITLAVVALGAIALTVFILRGRKPQAARFIDAPAERGDVQVTVTATGTLQGVSSVEVGAEVSGRVTKLFVDFNDQVEVGQVLAEIDPEVPQATVDETSARVASAGASINQAKATVEETRLALERTELMVKEGVATTRELEAARAAAIRADEKIAGLTKDIQIARGKQVFLQTCFVCHQTEGQGIPGQIPPLAKSDYLMSDKQRSIRAVLQGLTGEVEVNGKKYNGIMTPLNTLSDTEIANVLTYVRNSFGNSGEAVSADEVKRQRGELPPPAANKFE